ncbi:MAG: hypothetical protein AABX51_08590 [Nanoarchaeota archaeon]
MKKVTALGLLLATLTLSLLFYLYLPFIQSVGAGLSNQSSSALVITRVNVTNSPPFVSNLSITTPVNLAPNSSVNLTCNATVLDYNNWSDIKQVNFSFFSSNLSSSEFANTNRSHYDLFNCTSSEELSPYERRYNCWAVVNYNAFFDNWTCNITAVDVAGLQNTKKITTTVNDLISFFVPDELNFGDVPVTNTSANFHLNMTNFGNQPLNYSAYAYAATENDSAVMLCQFGNITIGNMKFTVNQSNISSLIDFDNELTQVNNSNATRSSLGVVTYPYNETLSNPINGSTWRLRVPLGPAGTPAGLCNGSLIITAFKAFNSVA